MLYTIISIVICIFITLKVFLQMFKEVNTENNQKSFRGHFLCILNIEKYQI